jgi:hypothetical protein
MLAAASSAAAMNASRSLYQSTGEAPKIGAFCRGALKARQKLLLAPFIHTLRLPPGRGAQNLRDLLLTPQP